MATACRDGSVRVWDAESGLPLTPNLRHARAVWYVTFSGDGTGLLTASGAVNSPLDATFQELPTVRVWDLKPEERPASDLAALAMLYGGQRIHPGGTYSTLSGEEVRQAWKQLMEKYPQEFQVTKHRARTWRTQQFLESLNDDDWPSTVLHGKWLLKELVQ